MSSGLLNRVQTTSSAWLVTHFLSYLVLFFSGWKRSNWCCHFILCAFHWCLCQVTIPECRNSRVVLPEMFWFSFSDCRIHHCEGAPTHIWHNAHSKPQQCLILETITNIIAQPCLMYLFTSYNLRLRWIRKWVKGKFCLVSKKQNVWWWIIRYSISWST